MKKADSNITLMRVVSTLALMLFASGCEQQMHPSRAGKVDEIPLLVRFEMKDASWCPAEVLQVVESCESLPPDVKPGSDLVCRSKDKKIIWLAVSGTLAPYQQDPRLPQFRLDGVPAKKVGRDPCGQSTDGALDCKIDSDAHGEYKYSVYAGACSLDPRIYVP
jgi:hypothetical protein